MLVAGIIVAVIGVALIFLSAEAREDVARALRFLGWVVLLVGVVLILVWLVRELVPGADSTAMLLPLPLVRLLERLVGDGRWHLLTVKREPDVATVYIDGRQVAQRVTDRPR